MRLEMRHVLFTALYIFITTVIGCHEPPKATESDRNKPPELATSDFISAAPNMLYSANYSENPLVHSPPDYIVDGLFEGNDIYRVLDDRLIAYVNHLRGLQLIDISDIDNPTVIGNLRFSGSANELYMFDQYICVLINDWRGYSGKDDALLIERYNGAVVLVIDVSDPTEPQITDRQNLPGTIHASRMARSASSAALYIAAVQTLQASDTTTLRSFQLADNGKIVPTAEINVGPFVQHIQVSSDAMLIAHGDYNGWDSQDKPCHVTIVDTSSTNGAIDKGADIPVAGHVLHECNLGLHNGILRIASGLNRTGIRIKYFETFNVTDIHTPIPVDQLDFGETENFSASLILDDKAFFVQYAYEKMYAVNIDEEGKLELHTEYGIKNNNNFFKPVFNQTRMIGIQTHIYNPPYLELRLYDISDLSLSDPLVASGKFAISADWSDIEISNNSRFFEENAAFASIFENAVSVSAPNGVIETGLALLPFQVTKQGQGRMSGAQIVTFSNQTVTNRGVIEQDNMVRQSYLINHTAMVNLSATDLNVFDITHPDQPVESGHIYIAPNYDNFFVFGNYGVRHRINNEGFAIGTEMIDNINLLSGILRMGDSPLSSNLPSPFTELPSNTLEVIALNQNPEKAVPMAILEIPFTAQVFQINDLIVTVETEHSLPSDLFSVPSDIQTETHIQVYDFKDPAHPKKAGTFTTDKLKISNNFSSDYSDYTIYALENSLLFYGITIKSEDTGVENICTTSAIQDISLTERSACNAFLCKTIMVPSEDHLEDTNTDIQPGQDAEEKWYSGEIECRNLEDQPPVCTGAISVCQKDANDCIVCEKIDPDTIETQTQCVAQPAEKSWYEMTLNVLDLTEPKTPKLFLNTHTFEENECISDVLPARDKLYCHYQVFDSQIDEKKYNKHYIKIIDASNPSELSVGPGINIPGWLLHVDDTTIFTRDVVWKGKQIESSLNRLVIEDDRAVLKSRHTFENQDVVKMVIDDYGYAYVSHFPLKTEDNAWFCPFTPPEPFYPHHYLTVLDTKENEFTLLSSTEINSNAVFKDVAGKRALFSVPRGVFAINLIDPEAPFSQAFFPMRNWPHNIVSYDHHIAFTGELHGIYSLSADDVTLDEQFE